MLKIPHCLDSRLKDGGKFVSPMHQPHFTPQIHYCFYANQHLSQWCSQLLTKNPVHVQLHINCSHLHINTAFLFSSLNQWQYVYEMVHFFPFQAHIYHTSHGTEYGSIFLTSKNTYCNIPQEMFTVFQKFCIRLSVNFTCREPSVLPTDCRLVF
jgi:hypothetical protein